MDTAKRSPYKKSQLRKPGKVSTVTGGPSKNGNLTKPTAAIRPGGSASHHQRDSCDYSTHVTRARHTTSFPRPISWTYSLKVGGAHETDKEIQCPQGCGVVVYQSDLTRHRNSCMMEEQECRFKNLGCTTIRSRKAMEEHMSIALTYHLSIVLANQEAQKEKILSMEKSQRRLQAECEQLKADNDTIMTKINQVGALLPSLRDSLKVGDTMHFKLGQLITVLTDISAIPIGGSVTLELSKKITRGYHFVVIDTVVLQLEWKYGQSYLELQLFLTEPEDIPGTLTCEFIAQLEPHEEQRGKSIVKTLAVVCNGVPQLESEHAPGAFRKPIGPEKKESIYSDTSLILIVREHKVPLTRQGALKGPLKSKKSHRKFEFP